MPSYHISDAQIHALVGDGINGKAERIQTFRCQACGATFSARRGTPLYHRKTTSHRVAEVLTALAEGLSVSAAVRVFGYRHMTITTWLTRAGEHTATLHDRWFRNLHLPHIQLDEIRTRLRKRVHGVWLWLAMDPISKLIPVLHLGARTQDAAHIVVHELRQRLAPDCLPVFTSDGLNQYFYALTAHFGQGVDGVGRQARHWQVAARLLYGQVKKRYRYRRLIGVTYVLQHGGPHPPNLVDHAGGATAVAPSGMVAGVLSFRAPHTSLRVPLAQPRERGGKRQPQRYRQRTPAMAAGLTRRRWTVRELLVLPLPPEPFGAG